eukprot:COSAG02_NODE_38500_length_428_cov_0.942249_1_plen_71_part_01
MALDSDYDKQWLQTALRKGSDGKMSNTVRAWCALRRFRKLWHIRLCTDRKGGRGSGAYHPTSAVTPHTSLA